jgi:methyl-accepting chemotaxis protein
VGQLVWLNIGVGILCTALVFASTWIIVGYLLTDKMGRMTTVIKKISTGDIAARIDNDLKESEDEIGELARAFDRTLASLKLAMVQKGKKD